MKMHGAKTRWGVFALATVLSVCFSLFFLFGRESGNPSTSKQLHIHEHLQVAKFACEGTPHPELCVSTLLSVATLPSTSISTVIAAAVNHTADDVSVSASNCSHMREELHNLNTTEKMALEDCYELLEETVDQMDACISDLYQKYTTKHMNEIRTLLSAAVTNQDTCLDGLSLGSAAKLKKQVESRLDRSMKMVCNSLAMLKKIPASKGRVAVETESGNGEMVHGFPYWLKKKDRKLLQASDNGTSFNLIVAKDGSGDYSTISEALAVSPNKSSTRFIIYIKAGVYEENLEVPRKKPNIMFIGDGIDKTIITGNRSVKDGWTTFRSATVAVVGNGFIARDITFQNTAGPSKHQAVALRSGSDFSVFYRCSFLGYQDTLYAHSLRQFYRECDVYGTVDFIFGDASVVFQNCSLYARKPNPGQKNLITAQGREDPNQNTGITIQACKISAAVDLAPVKDSFKTYLGRPWKQYSRTVIMESDIDDVVDPTGWLEWSGDFALDTLYYAEYNNSGVGANTTSRVNWPGYKVLNQSEAVQFTVREFIQGPEWLGSTRVPFVSGFH